VLGRDVGTQHLDVARDAGAGGTRARQATGELIGDLDATVADSHSLEVAGGVVDVGCQNRHRTVIDVVHVLAGPLVGVGRGVHIHGLDVESERCELDLLGGLGEVAGEVERGGVFPADREVVGEVDPAAIIELHGAHDDIARGDVDELAVREVVGRVDPVLLHRGEHAVVVGVDVGHHGDVLHRDGLARRRAEHPSTEVDGVASLHLEVLGRAPRGGELHLEDQLLNLGVAGVLGVGAVVDDLGVTRVDVTGVLDHLILGLELGALRGANAADEQGEQGGEDGQGRGTHCVSLWLLGRLGFAADAAGVDSFLNLTLHTAYCMLYAVQSSPTEGFDYLSNTLVGGACKVDARATSIRSQEVLSERLPQEQRSG